MVGLSLTRDKFTQYKREYSFFRPSHTTDANGDVITHVPTTPSARVTCMWNPVKDAVLAQGYGLDVSSMLSAVVYDEPDIQGGDVVTIDGDAYTVAGVRRYHASWTVDVSREKGAGI